MVQSQSEVRSDSTESANLFRPRPADAVVASPSTAAGPEAVSPAVSSLPVPGSMQLDPVELTLPIEAPATITLDAIPTRSRMLKRFAVLGALTVVGVAASLSLLTPGRAPITVVDAGAPVAVIPASDLNGSAGLPSNDHPASVPVAIMNAEGAAPTAPVAAPKPRATHNTNRTATTSRSTEDTARTAPRSDPRAAAAESYVRSRAAELRDQHWKRFTSPRP